MPKTLLFGVVDNCFLISCFLVACISVCSVSFLLHQNKVRKTNTSSKVSSVKWLLSYSSVRHQSVMSLILFLRTAWNICLAVMDVKHFIVNNFKSPFLVYLKQDWLLSQLIWKKQIADSTVSVINSISSNSHINTSTKHKKDTSTRKQIGVEMEIKLKNKVFKISKHLTRRTYLSYPLC